MNDKHIDEQIKKHYQKKNLTPKKLEQLLLLAASDSAKNNTPETKTKKQLFLNHSFKQQFAIAASVCLLILLTLQALP